MGFVLTQEQAKALIIRDERNRSVLFPYLNGEDLNTKPDQSPSRWVINFQDWPLDRCAKGSWMAATDEIRNTWLRAGHVPGDYPKPVATDFPDCLEILERLAKPERDKNKRAAYRERWWQFGERQAALYAATKDNRRILLTAIVTKYLAPVFVGRHAVYAHKCCGFASERSSFFAALQSSWHEIWTREFSSTLETRLNYSPTDCCETFPFPIGTIGLESIGEDYHELRRQIMLSRQEGLTKIYNRFHDRGEQSKDIKRLRALHVEMDQTMADAYGWSGLELGHDFHPTKQGERYTISESARRTILDKMLELNHQRYAEELAVGLHDRKGKRVVNQRKQGAESKSNTLERELFT
jgi:hypothetical protein